jgi:hypothetical protein
VGLGESIGARGTVGCHDCWSAGLLGVQLKGFEEEDSGLWKLVEGELKIFGGFLVA